MTQEEIQRLRDYIHEQVQIVAQNSEERYIVVDRLQGTFIDATRECLGRLEKHLKSEQEMYRAVLEYAKTAKTHDARVAMTRALDQKFKSAEDVQSWIAVWDPA